MPDAATATRKGYLMASKDGTTIANVGHVFGRLGEGEKNFPDKNAPFYWGTKSDANTPGIEIALFPETEGDAGLTSG